MGRRKAGLAPLGWGPHRARSARADVRSAASSFLKRINFLMTRSHMLPPGPPPEVLDEIDAAWERAQAVVEGAYELHFEPGRFSGASARSCARPTGRRCAF